MAVVVTLDEINEAMLDTQLTQTSRFVRSGTVTGIDVSVLPDQEALFKIQQAVGIPLGSALSVARPNYILQRILSRGFSGDGGRVQLVYETVNFNGIPPSTYIIRDRGYASQASTKFLLNSLVPMRHDLFTWPGSTRTTDADTATQNVYTPMRAVTVSSLTYSQPTSGQDYMCYVNSIPWYGKGVGYWLLAEYSTDVSRYSGYYTLTATAITRVFRDWSEYSNLVDHQTGQTVPIAAGDISYLKTVEYAPVIDKVPGALRAGHYPMVAFQNIFGF